MRRADNIVNTFNRTEMLDKLTLDQKYGLTFCIDEH